MTFHALCHWYFDFREVLSNQGSLVIHLNFSSPYCAVYNNIIITHEIWSLWATRHMLFVNCLLLLMLPYCCSIALKGDDGNLLFDFSKNIISDQTLTLLFKLVSAFIWYIMVEDWCAYECRPVLKEWSHWETRCFQERRSTSLRFLIIHSPF